MQQRQQTNKPKQFRMERKVVKNYFATSWLIILVNNALQYTLYRWSQTNRPQTEKCHNVTQIVAT